MPRKSGVDGEPTASLFAPAPWPIISKIGMALYAIWWLNGGMVIIGTDIFHLIIQR